MKSDKELAVELAVAYISAWFSREVTGLKPLTGEELKSIVADAYEAVKNIT